MLTNSPTTYAVTCPPRSDAGVLKLRGITEPISEDPLTITPVTINGSSVFGAEVEGVDWTAPVAPEIVKQVRSSTGMLAILELLLTMHSSL